MTENTPTAKTETISQLLSWRGFSDARLLAERVVATYEDNLPLLPSPQDAAKVAAALVADAWDWDAYETEDQADDELCELYGLLAVVLTR